MIQRLKRLHPMNNLGVPWDRLPEADHDCPNCGLKVYLDLRMPLNQLRCRECGHIGLMPEVPDELRELWRSREST